MLFFWICISLFAPCSGKAQITRADSLIHAGEYLAARVELERLIYQGQSQPHSNEIFLKKSLCYKATREYDKALATLQRADLYSGPDSIRIQLFYESILNAYLTDKHDIALSQLKELNYNFEDIEIYALDIIEILALAATEHWRESKASYQKFSQRYQLNLDTTIFDHVINHRFKRPPKAAKLSYFFPGAGLMYAGAPVRALTSIGLQGGSVALAIHGFSKGYYFTNVFTGVALFYLLYNGGAQYAAAIAEKKNDAFREDFQMKLKNSIPMETPK